MKILAIGAHPDDLELSCAGTLALFRRRGDEVFMCHACAGDKGSTDKKAKETADARQREALASAEVIGAISLWGGFLDDEVVCDLASRLRMVDVIRHAAPDVIITHHPYDYMTDHVNVSRLVFEAAYPATVPLLKTDHLHMATVPRLYYMDTLAGINFVPTEYVDITATIDIKVRMMRKMASQLGWLKEMHDSDAEEYIKTVARFRGLQAGVRFAEAFVHRPLYPGGLTTRALP
jgi:LmbE family N-acetylglucosaminyl deacetylase